MQLGSQFKRQRQPPGVSSLDSIVDSDSFVLHLESVCLRFCCSLDKRSFCKPPLFSLIFLIPRAVATTPVAVITSVFKEWRGYLEGAIDQIDLYTDHVGLKWYPNNHSIVGKLGGFLSSTVGNFR